MDNYDIEAPIASAQKTKLTHSIPATVIAFILLVFFVCITAASVGSVCVMVEEDFYISSPEHLKEQMFQNFAWRDGSEVYRAVTTNDGFDFDSAYGKVNFSCKVYNVEGKILFDNSTNTKNSYVLNVPTYDDNGEARAKVLVYVDKSFPVTDRYSMGNSLVNIIYALRYWVYVIGALSLLASIALFVFLMCASGHRGKTDDISAGFFTKIPLDLLTGATGLLMFLILQLAIEATYTMNSAVLAIITTVSAGVACFAILIGFCMSFATRVKLGKWWQNTIIYFVLYWLWKVLKAIGRSTVYLFRNLPLIWKTALFMAALGLLSLFVIMSYDDGFRVMCWIFGMLLLCVIVGYSAIAMRRLQLAAQKLAKGDLSEQVDTKYMLWDFKEHGENLNNISIGMTRAVDERLKSERLKTELITNVSHDIKTPLTSIINYVDLISKEKCDNKKIKEYVEVLSRQSERLKKLIEDLVEASKASTGNVDVSLSPCDVGVLLSQTAGEYETKLSDCSLELVVAKPEAPVMIMADGRLLWRVFDNLMNNIAKYAQPGTRVYLSLESKNGSATVFFKNTSKYPLNITADELMERFVRGDSSRHTEGSGLGLSIAKSLIELQCGSLELTIDGDFFKVSLEFKTI